MNPDRSKSTNSRTRVLFLCNSPAVPAGVEKTALLLLERLDSTRFDSRVILNGEGPFAESLRNIGADTEIIPCRTRTSSVWRRALRLSLQNRPAEVVQLHLSRLNAFLLHRAGAAVIERLNMTRDSRIRHPLSWRWLDLWTARWIDRFIVVSETLRTAFVERGYPDRKLRVIRNGVEPPRSMDPAKLRRELGISPRVPLIGAVGRLTPQKGMDLFIETVRELRKTLPTVQAILVGDGELRGALEIQAGACGVRNIVHFLGYRQDIPDVLAGLDALVFLSRWEPFANTLLEAMAAGTPVVASDVDGNREALSANGGGVLVPPERPDLAAAALRRIVENPALGKELSAAGRRRAGEFTVERMVRQHEELYADVAAHR